MDDVSSQRCYSCDFLSSSRITRLHRYYDAIRLPLLHLPSFLYYQLSGILASKQENRGSPGLPYIHFVRHAMVFDPGEALHDLPFASRHIDFRKHKYVVPHQITFRGSFPSTLRLTAYRLAILRLIARITSFDPRTRYPVAGQPSGTGFAPARIYVLCPAALEFLPE